MKALRVVSTLFPTLHGIGRVGLEKRGVNLGADLLGVFIGNVRRRAVPEPLRQALAFSPQPPLGTLTNKNKKEGPKGEGRRIEDGGTSKANKRTSRRRTTQPQTHHRRRHGNNKFLFGSHCEAKLAERSH